MPPRRGRPRKGDRRIDAAIDHFAAMGYAARDVRAVVDRLLKLYGIGADAWPLLEEGSYQLVLDMLIQKQQEEERQLLLEHHPKEEEPQGELGQDPPQELGQEFSQHQGPVEDEAPPENSMQMLEVHQEAPAQPESPDEGVEDPVFPELPAPEVVVPLPIVVRSGGTVRPCYGWISESDDEEELAGHQPQVHVPTAVGVLPYKRKRSE